MGNEVVGPHLETPEVLRLCGLPYSTLDSWVRTGLVTPSIRNGTGKRRTRLWSVRDVVTVRALKELRDAGANGRLLARARAILQDEWPDTLRDRMLYWDGGDLVHLDEWDNLTSLIRKPGQTVLRFVAVPLDAVQAEAETAAHDVRSTSATEPRRSA